MSGFYMKLNTGLKQVKLKKNEQLSVVIFILVFKMKNCFCVNNNTWKMYINNI